MSLAHLVDYKECPLHLFHLCAAKHFVLVSTSILQPMWSAIIASSVILRFKALECYSEADKVLPEFAKTVQGKFVNLHVCTHTHGHGHTHIWYAHMNV